MFQNANLINLIDGIPHAVLLVDEHFAIRQMNRRAEALTGRSSEDIKGARLESILKSNLNPAEKYFGPALRSRQNEVIEGDVLDQNRKITPARFSISAIVTDNDDLLGGMVIVEDLSLELEKTGAAGLEKMVSLSPNMQELYDQITIFAGTDASVLIDGETGTGKGFIAGKIHQASKRAGFPFIKVHCGALPEQLLESELFGHVKGAFPGAENDKPGMFRLAARGTVYLTEIGDLPLNLQAKLLTVLDEGLFMPKGSTEKIAMNVRIIAATSKNLRAMVSEGQFREDLLYRLKVLQLHLPSLRDHLEDVPLLVDQFIGSLSPGKTAPDVDPEVIQALKEYSFPGNIRELRNIIEYAFTLCHGGAIAIQHLPDYLFQEHNQIYPAAKFGFQSSQYNGPVFDGKSVKWEDVEKEMIIEALRKSRGKRNEAAKILGWARSTLYRKLKYYQI